MDWRDLIDERNRREQARRAAMATTSRPAAVTPSVTQEDDGGFFGGIGQAVSNVGKAVKGAGSFFGKMVEDVADSAGTAIKTVKAMGEGVYDQVIGNKRIEEAQKALKQLNNEYNSGSIDLAEYNRKMGQLKEYQAETSRILENKDLQELDPLKSAAATADTFINVATLGGASVLKSGGKTAVKQAAKEALKEGGESLAKQAAKKIGANAAEGAVLNAGQGILQPLKEKGSDATARDIWGAAATGGAFGAVMGGGGTFFDKNVRAGVREMPGIAKDAIGDAAGAIKRYDAQLGQGGYVRVPFVKDTPNPSALESAMSGADVAQKQLMGDEFKPMSAADQEAEQFAQDIASKYKSADEYITETAKRARDAEAGVRGGYLIPDNEQYGSGYTRASDHLPWYSDLYSETGRKPTLQAIKNMVEDSLASGKGIAGVIDPEEARVYQLLKERDASMAQTLAEGPPPDMSQQFLEDITGQARTAGPVKTRMPAGLPKGPQAGQSALDEAMGRVPQYDSPDALQSALGRMESETNPLVDYVDPMKRGGVTPTEQSSLPITPTDNYANAKPDYSLKALPAGEPIVVSPKEAKARFKKNGEVADFVNKQDPAKEPIALLPTTEESSKIAVRQTKGGKLKPLATNNAHITKDDVAAIRAIADDDTGSAFTTMRTPEMNLEEALRKRGGTASKEFKVLSKYNTSIREHTAEFTREIDRKRGVLERFVSEYGLNGKSAADMRPYLEAGNKEASEEALKQYAALHGEKAAEGLVKLRAWWRTTKDEVRAATNEQIEKFAGKDRTMGDLGATYVPRVYKGKTFKDSVLDLAHGGMEAIGGKKGLFNLENGTGYLSKETETFGGVLRNSEGIPLNSELAKPNTTYLSAAQKRTANAPIKELEDPITSMMRYFEATGRARYFTEDIARGRTLQKAIEMINNETGNLRQVYKAFDDQINSVAGKTSRFDRPFVDSETGAKFVNVATKLQSRISKSTIVGSASSAVAQTGQLPLILAENGAGNFRKGMQDLFKFVRSKAPDPLDESALMTSRYPANESMFTTKKSTKLANKATEVIAKPFHIIERASSELAWRSSYNKVLESGLTGKEAVQEADRITAKIIGERSPGARAALYESKALGPVTSYTLEVNQLYQVAKQYFKRDPKKAAKLVGAIWLYNQGYEAVMGNSLNADPLQAALDAGSILTSNETDAEGNKMGAGEKLSRAAGRIGGELLDATPLGGPVAGQIYPEQGFRIPFGGGERTMSRADVFGGTNFGRYGGGTPIASGISNPLLLLGIPGMSQLQRSVEGAAAYNEGASLTPTGKTRFDIEQNPENYWRAILFGMYNTEEGRAYLAAQNARLAGQSQQSNLRY